MGTIDKNVDIRLNVYETVTIEKSEKTIWE